MIGRAGTASGSAIAQIRAGMESPGWSFASANIRGELRTKFLPKSERRVG